MKEDQKYIVTVECALIKDGKFLIIQRPAGGYAPNVYAFPGGKVDIEDGMENILETAAKRETLEEVGIEVLDELKHVTSLRYVVGDGIQVINNVFVAYVDKTVAEVRASPTEVQSWGWMSRQEIEESPLTPIWLKHYISLIDEGSMVEV